MCCHDCVLPKTWPSNLTQNFNVHTFSCLHFSHSPPGLKRCSWDGWLVATLFPLLHGQEAPANHSGQEHETNWTAEASGEHKIGRRDSFPVFGGNWLPPGGIQPPCETSEWSCGSESPFFVMVAGSAEWVKRLSLCTSRRITAQMDSLFMLMAAGCVQSSGVCSRQTAAPTRVRV